MIDGILKTDLKNLNFSRQNENLREKSLAESLSVFVTQRQVDYPAKLAVEYFDELHSRCPRKGENDEDLERSISY